MRLAAALFALIPSFAFAATSMSIAVQRDAPVQIQSATHGSSDALESAIFINRSGRVITGYQIGWVSVVAGKAELHRSMWMNTPGGVAAGISQSVPAQKIRIDKTAENMTFFVSGVSFADGSHWNARMAVLLTQTARPR